MTKNARHPVLFCLAFLTSAVHVSTAETGLSARATLLHLAAPAPLDADEEGSAALQAIARRFNPAMALPIREVWPVELRYAWHDGSDLIARVEPGPEGPGDEQIVRAAGDLGAVDWSRLPHRRGDGRAIRYYVDAPGDDRSETPGGRSGWRQRFAEIAQAGGPGAAPTASPYPPTQYVHAFWWNRAQGLLAIQYWFYYPFNEWVNHHEGDWEHIQVILKGEPGGRLLRAGAPAAWTPIGFHYFFHDFYFEPPLVPRFAGATPGEDHPLVFVGGQSEWFGFSGVQSGGSYPLPGRYPGAAFNIPWLSPDDDTSQPARFIAAADFKLIVLPEPERLDAQRFPELSWLRLPFYVGRRAGFRNLPGTDEACGRPPLQPAARAEWGGPPPYPHWTGHVRLGTAAQARWPASWTCAHPGDRRSCLSI